ncbi:hypothetical protein BDC45DRAFT_576439 [Circinella umbellata]|nr:hypothetical protein BDC45DRAFT_576439 [Circinella umbellata]
MWNEDNDVISDERRYGEKRRQDLSRLKTGRKPPLHLGITNIVLLNPYPEVTGSMAFLFNRLGSPKCANVVGDDHLLAVVSDAVAVAVVELVGMAWSTSVGVGVVRKDCLSAEPTRT